MSNKTLSLHACTASLYHCVSMCVTHTMFNRGHIMATTMTPSIHTTVPASVEETPRPGLVLRFILADTHCVLLLLLLARERLCWHTRHMLLAPNFHPKA